jgi:hypothetical protein
MISFAVIEDFWPFGGDIGPFLRPDLGRKLGDSYQLQIYINQAFLRLWKEIQMNIFQAKAIFMQGSY